MRVDVGGPLRVFQSQGAVRGLYSYNDYKSIPKRKPWRQKLWGIGVLENHQIVVNYNIFQYFHLICQIVELKYTSTKRIMMYLLSPECDHFELLNPSSSLIYVQKWSRKLPEKQSQQSGNGQFQLSKTHPPNQGAGPSCGPKNPTSRRCHGSLYQSLTIVVQLLVTSMRLSEFFPRGLNTWSFLKALSVKGWWFPMVSFWKRYKKLEKTFKTC